MTPDEWADQLIDLFARERGYNHGTSCADLWDDEDTAPALAAAIRAAVAGEREACAQIADEHAAANERFQDEVAGRMKVLAEAIRARGAECPTT